MGRRRAIERPPLAKLGTCKFTFSSKTNPFGCQARGGAEVAGTEDKGVHPGQMLPPAQHLLWPPISRSWIEKSGKLFLPQPNGNPRGWKGGHPSRPETLTREFPVSPWTMAWSVGSPSWRPILLPQCRVSLTPALRYRKTTTFPLTCPRPRS